MDIQKINNNAVQQIIDAFTEQLIGGQIKPGDQIPTEVELAERFGVARNTVREAVKILVAMGVLDPPPRRYLCLLRLYGDHDQSHALRGDPRPRRQLQRAVGAA